MTEALTAERLRALFSYELTTGDFTRLVRTSNSVHIGDVAGSMNGNGYIVIKVDGRSYQAHRLAWLYVRGEWPGGMLDHRDTNKANNKWDNLREATSSQNGANAPVRASNTIGFKGVRQWGRKYRAQIKAPNGRIRHLGLYATPESAHARYCEAARELHGEFARAA